MAGGGEYKGLGGIFFYDYNNYEDPIIFFIRGTYDKRKISLYFGLSTISQGGGSLNRISLYEFEGGRTNELTTRKVLFARYGERREMSDLCSKVAIMSFLLWNSDFV